jgi:putative transposase
VAADIRTIFNVPDRPLDEAQLRKVIAKYEITASKLANWLKKSNPEGLTVLDFPNADP